MEEMQFKENSAVEFRRDVIRCLIYFFLVFVFFGIAFVVLSTRLLQNIERQNKLFIDEVSRLLKGAEGKGTLIV